MNEQDIRELLKLIRGIEHFLERCLKTMTEKQLKDKGVEITEEKELVCECGVELFGEHLERCPAYEEIPGFEF